MDMKFEDNGS